MKTSRQQFQLRCKLESGDCHQLTKISSKESAAVSIRLNFTLRKFMTATIIDINPIFRAGLRVFLERHFNGIAIFESGNVHDYQKFSPDAKPDIILVNLSQTDSLSDTLEISFLKWHYESAALIVYEELKYIHNIPDYFAAGVMGYVTKRSDLSELFTCVELVLSGRQYVSLDALELMLAKILVGQDDPTSADFHTMTAREQKIATYLSEGLSVTGIARKLNRSKSTISLFKSKIFTKMKVSTIDELRKRVINQIN